MTLKSRNVPTGDRGGSNKCEKLTKQKTTPFVGKESEAKAAAEIYRAHRREIGEEKKERENMPYWGNPRASWRQNFERRSATTAGKPDPRQYSDTSSSSQPGPLAPHVNIPSLATHLDVSASSFKSQSGVTSTSSIPPPSHVIPTFHTSQLDISSQFQSIQRENTEIQRQQVHLLKRLMLPAPKPPVFDGEILEYPRWESAL